MAFDRLSAAEACPAWRLEREHLSGRGGSSPQMGPFGNPLKRLPPDASEIVIINEKDLVPLHLNWYSLYSHVKIAIESSNPPSPRPTWPLVPQPRYYLLFQPKDQILVPKIIQLLKLQIHELNL